ncbi:MAG: hypothetical protein K0S41_2413 [Anaerocolumna sp.]|jgi:hypothetical protein|nr:hypothetical protein [Anaerocolumna sp.]
MKNQLSYQASEYDCGPTTLLNAMRYLFEREEIVPEIIKTISLYTLDAYDNNGEYGKSGTSCMAMQFLSNWFNHFGEIKNFPIHTEILLDDRVWLGQNSKINECLQQGGAVILCVWLGNCKHYILLTDLEDEYLGMFDPYDWEIPINGSSILKVEDQPKRMNRKVKMEVINDMNEGYYSLGKKQGREAMLIYNVKTRKTPEKTIEYFI